MTEEEIFAQALEKESTRERQAFLDEACGQDLALRARVELLLEADGRSRGILEHPARPVDATVEYVPSATVGTVIAGRYKLLEEIGEGGMGAVWVAEQTEPVRRKVALKLVKAGMDSRSVLARFEAERQALALMDHPNIAKVLDGGMLDNGRPFFVMEYVKGVPITEYCDATRLSVSERLNLFVQVCQAVQHAHQKGIIHRDLKPSNILVAPYDDRPVPKVIDFGLAKALHHSLTERTLHTAHETVLGTPLYMSPEQAQLNNLDVDTRSDIYSLGVLLYELLTSTTPLEKQRFKEAAWDEVRRIIRDEEPPRPSARLSSTATLPSLAACRQTQPTSLTKQVRGELDWIVMKALEKDRSRRYETANGFAQDVERFLAGEPVLAVPPRASYRLKKFASRHQVALTTAAAIILLLVAGVGISSWQAIRATRAEAQALVERDEKEQARQEADAARRKAEDAADRLQQATVLAGQGQLFTRERRWSEAHAAFAKAEELEPGLNSIYVSRRAMHADMGLWKQAADDDLKVAAIAGPVWDSAGWFEYALLRLYVGDESGYRDACRQVYSERFGKSVSRDSVRICNLTSNPVIEPAEVMRRAQKGNSFQKTGPGLYVEGLAHYRAGQFKKAVDCQRESLTVVPSWNSGAINYPALAMAYHRLGLANEAISSLALAEEAINRWTELMVKGSVGTIPIPWTDWLECHLYYREAKLLLTGVAPPEDPRLRTVRDRALAALSVGDVERLMEKGREHAARGEWGDSTSAYARALETLHSGVGYFSRGPAKCAEIVQWPEVFAKLVAQRPQDGRLWVARGQSLARARQWKDAVRDYARVMEDRLPDDGATYEYACLLLLSGDTVGYQRFSQKLADKYEPSTSPFLSFCALGVCGLAPGGISDPARLVAWAKPWRDRLDNTGWVHNRLGVALYRNRQWEEAIESLQAAKPWAERQRPSMTVVNLDYMFLALAHERLGKSDEARRWRQLADEWLASADEEIANEPYGFPETVHAGDWLGVQVLRREADNLLRSPN
jgi:serine/threonine protein kinase